MCLASIYDLTPEQFASIIEPVQTLRRLREVKHEMRGTKSILPEIVVGEMAVTETLQQGIAA